MNKTTDRDLPKVEGKPKPEEPVALSVYLTPSGQMRAWAHSPDGKQIYWDGVVLNPENFCATVDAFRERAKKD